MDSKDVLMYMAMGMEYEDIINLCLSNKKYNRYLCENQYFWKNKLIQDYDFRAGELKHSKYIYRYLEQFRGEKGNKQGVRTIYRPKFQRRDLTPTIILKVGFLEGVERGDIIVVKELLKDERVDPSAGYNDAIIMASKNGHLEIVKLLLKDQRVDPSDRRNFAIRWASEKGRLNVVKELLNDPRVNPTDFDNYAIIVANLEGHSEIVKELEKHGARLL